jgi:alkanesulfonate monooxygenase SsuD/methylene tetrahydromethanopterin reductase-like flavin-dependent oxidoreductase (luciferase family)
VIFQAGVSDEGRNLAAHVAEGIYAPGGTLAKTQAYYADIKQRTAGLGRDPDHVLIFLGAAPVIAGTDAEAHRLSREIFDADNDFTRKLAAFGRAFGAYDFAQHDLDAPFPDVAALAEKSSRTRGTAVIRRAREEGLTLRETVLAFTEYQPSPFTGDPRTVANTIEHWFAARSFDGLNVGFRTTEDLERFVADVVPLLQRRGLFRTEYESGTLRGNLGLPVPENRWSAQRDLATVEH